MTTLSTAWANRATARVPMLHIGDSVTEGYGAGGFEGKYTTKLMRALQSDAGIAGGPGFINSGTWADVDNSSASFWNPVPTIAQTGFLGSHYGQIPSGASVTLTYTGTSFDLFFMQGYTSAQPMSVAIDGGAPTSVPITTTGNANYGGFWHSPTLASGTHTAVISPTAGQTLTLLGVHIYDADENRGVHGWEGGHQGITAVAIAADPSGYFGNSVPRIQPAVVTMYLGLNDWANGITPASYQASLSSIITSVNGYCTTAPSWVICGIYNDVTGNNNPTYPLSAFTAAAKAVADADTVNRRFVDFNTAGVSLGSDQIHPTPAGHTAMATALHPALLSLAGASGSTGGSWSPLVAERWTGSAWTPLVAERWTGSAWSPLVIERSS